MTMQVAHEHKMILIILKNINSTYSKLFATIKLLNLKIMSNSVSISVND